MNASINETYIFLILEKVDSREMGDFRPISLISCMYKIIARVLSGRLKNVIPIPVSEFQLAFMECWQILHASFIVNELIKEWHCRKKRRWIRGLRSLDMGMMLYHPFSYWWLMGLVDSYPMHL